MFSQLCLNVCIVCSMQSDALLTDVSCSIVYALVCVTGSRLYIDDTGPITPANLAVTCLESSLPAMLFWQEDGLQTWPISIIFLPMNGICVIKL